MATKIKVTGIDWWFRCPACKTNHRFSSNRWRKIGTDEEPTFTPSLITEYSSTKKCHLSITNGIIKYHDDCFHEMAGQTVPMVDFHEDSSWR